jgi:hypothetical protein
MAVAALMLIGVAMCLLIAFARQKYLHIWIVQFIKQLLCRIMIRSRMPKGTIHVIFCLVDHFEPVSSGSTREQQRERMRQWMENFPVLGSKHKDSTGRSIQHTWFYPGEAYDAEYLDGLAMLCRQGYGEIELHLHHGDDTGETLRAKLKEAIRQFNKHGALMTQETPPRVTYGFIHGNLALDNSMGDASLCGVNDEISALRETGCYADFSMPTAPWISQTKKVNTIYYAVDDPFLPKSHNDGLDVEVGKTGKGDLLIVQGPLGFDIHNRKWRIFPKIDNGEIDGAFPPFPSRIRDWIRRHVHVKGRPEWVLVKVSCHGCYDPSREVLLGEVADQMYTYLENWYRDQEGYKLYYVTARELYNIVKAAEAGKTGTPAEYRDFVIPPYLTHDFRSNREKRI